MKYINRLEQINDERAARLVAIHAEIELFRMHLLSPKFHGLDVDGDRKDWIATADVLRWIETLRQTST